MTVFRWTWSLTIRRFTGVVFAVCLLLSGIVFNAENGHATIDRPVRVSGSHGVFKWVTWGYDIRGKTPRRKRLARFYHDLSEEFYQSLSDAGFEASSLPSFTMGKPPGSASTFVKTLRQQLSNSDTSLASYITAHDSNLTANRLIKKAQYKEFISQTPGLHLSLLWWVDHFYLVAKTKKETRAFKLPGRRSFGSIPMLISPSPNHHFIVYRSGGYGLRVIDQETSKNTSLTEQLEDRSIKIKGKEFKPKMGTPIKLRWVNDSLMGIIYDHGAHAYEEFLLVDIQEKSIIDQRTDLYLTARKWSSTISDTQIIINFKEYPPDSNRTTLDPIILNR